MNDKREIFGWTMYDWANSAFSTTVVTVFLGPYLSALAKGAADASGLLHLFGIPIRYDSLFPYAVSASVLSQAVFLPILGAIADYSHLRKFMLMLFAIIGSLATISLFFLLPGMHWFGALMFIIANLCFGASIVFYNAFLPDIASEDRRDSVSSRGFAMGYLGGGLLLLLNLIVYSFREKLGIPQDIAVRVSLMSAGLWWLGFSFITFSRLRSRHTAKPLPPGQTYLSIGFTQLAHTVREFKKYPETIKYLAAYLFYNDGIQTVIVVATIFAAGELGMDNSSLIPIILAIQFVAFGGSFLFEFLAYRLGTKRAIMLSLVVWSGVVIYAFAGMRATGRVLGMEQRQFEFWILAMVIALVLGGSQALSRSLFAQMIPKGREAEFFSFYEISDRGTSWLGPLIFGLANQLFHSLRAGILSVIILFIIGLGVLTLVNVPRAIREANREDQERLPGEAELAVA